MARIFVVCCLRSDSPAVRSTPHPNGAKELTLPAPKKDMHVLWRRIVFSVLISNTDDHLRNHGFLCAGFDGWHLAPAYEVNPVSADMKPRILTTAIDLNDGTASLYLALAVAEYFELTAADARAIAGDVGQAVAGWRDIAAAVGLTAEAIDRMASAFDYEELKAALAVTRKP